MAAKGTQEWRDNISAGMLGRWEDINDRLARQEATTQRLHAEGRGRRGRRGAEPDLDYGRIARELGRNIQDRMSWDLTDAEARQLGREVLEAVKEIRDGTR
jgi:hypothetical protein